MEAAREFIRNEAYDEAVARLQIATVLQPDRAGTWFELARARALDGNKKEALAALVQAAKCGYKDPARVEREKAFAALKNDAGFQDVLRAFIENQAAEKPTAKDSAR